MMITYTSRSRRGDGDSEITLKGTEEEIAALEKALLVGNSWVRRLPDNTIVEHSAYLTPQLTDDDDIKNHFQKVKSYFIDDSVKRLNRKKKDKDCEHPDPSIYVQHIAGYRDDYRKSADLMESVGFECLRSRRGKDGKYWEVWYLPGMWFAKGQLKGKKTEDMIEFLCRKIVPGSFEVDGQVWGLSIGD